MLNIIITEMLCTVLVMFVVRCLHSCIKIKGDKTNRIIPGWNGVNCDKHDCMKHPELHFWNGLWLGNHATK